MEYRRKNWAEVSWVRHDDRYGGGYVADPSKPIGPRIPFQTPDLAIGIAT
jgi:hypothetical protein